MIFPVKIPAIGESISEVVMGRWFKQNGDYVEVDEPICEIESDKATMEIPAEQSGVLQIKADTGDTLAVGDFIAEIDTEAEKPAVVEKAESSFSGAKRVASQTQSVQETSSETAETISVRITPVARKILEENKLSVDHVSGSGTDGKITKQDVLRALEMGQPRTPSLLGPPSSSHPSQPVRRVKMSTLRQTIARRLVSAKNEMAMLTTFNELDMSAVIQVRSENRDAFMEKYNIKLGYMSFFSHAVCRALADWPVANTMVDGDEIVYHDYVNLGIAVSTPKGLVVPVIRNAHHLSQPQLETELFHLADKARLGKLAIDDMTGGTFTITNGGVFGSLFSTPIINPPQVAVLGMQTIQERPVALDGQIVIRPMMYLSLSYDRRIIDGRESVGVLLRIKELLESPDPAHLEL